MSGQDCASRRFRPGWLVTYVVHGAPGGGGAVDVGVVVAEPVLGAEDSAVGVPVVCRPGGQAPEHRWVREQDVIAVLPPPPISRGRRGRAKLTPDLVATAQWLYDQGKHTMAQIAALTGVGSSTLYQHLDTRENGRAR